MFNPFSFSSDSKDKNFKSTRFPSVEEYVRSRGGKNVITKILIANNGIAAVKAIRSIRRFCYETFGNDRAIQFVVMATPEDAKANAAYIHLADEFVPVPGGTNNNNYANVELISEIAERCGAHAVWAGWGHASENPILPERLAQTKNQVVWMGPPPSAMRALGDKIGSMLIAQSVGVPCMAWSGDGIQVDYASEGEIPKELYMKSCVRNAIEALESCTRIGFPVMIKASEGGGGKGIRKVEKPEEVALAFEQVQGEVPGSPIFIMKLAPVARHLEVQLLADEYGNAIALAGRDCSIQRRHQKIIEEGPVLAAPSDVWKKMEQSAVRLAKEVGYVGAGTVEYLYTDKGDFYFLELNPRLQVEHPVTELITGVNLPAAQLQVAMGIPLHLIRGVRRLYQESVDTFSLIDFDNRDYTLVPGHVIACRITAENPDDGFRPTSGHIQELNFRSSPDVWGYFSVSSRSSIHEFSDSQFGHVFAFGETREDARVKMAMALKELSIRGEIRTTVEYLRQMLETEDYKQNRITTTWLEGVLARKAISTEKPQPCLAVSLGALYHAHKQSSAKLKEYMSCLERGQLPSALLHSQLTESRVDLIYENVKYTVKVTLSGPTRFDLTVNEQTNSAEIHQLSDDGLLVLLDAHKHLVYGQETPVGLRLTVDGQTCLFTEEYDPTQLRSTLQGKLVRFLCADGAHLEKNSPFAEIEVMKMYITLLCPESGVITLRKPEGSVIEAGELLATLTLDDPDKVQKAELFQGSFPALREPLPIADKHNARLEDAIHKLKLHLQSGYLLGPSTLNKALDDLMFCLRSPLLPLSYFKDILSTIVGRVPNTLFDKLTNICSAYAKNCSVARFHWESPENFPVADVEEAIASTNKELGQADRDKLAGVLQRAGLTTLLQQCKEGNAAYACNVLSSLLTDFYEVEEHFNTSAEGGNRPEAVISALRKQYPKDLEKIARIARAHHAIQQRAQLVQRLLAIIETQLRPLLYRFVAVLKKLAILSSVKECNGVVLKARQLLMLLELPSPDQRSIALQTILLAAASASGDARLSRLLPLIDQSQPIEDLIFSFLTPAASTCAYPQYHSHQQHNIGIQTVALEAYIRRVYQVYDVPHVEVNPSPAYGNALLGKWEFAIEQERKRNQSDADFSAEAAQAVRANLSPITVSSPLSQQPSGQLTSSAPTTILSSTSAPKTISGREAQQQYFLQRTDSVNDIQRLRSLDSSVSTSTSSSSSPSSGSGSLSHRFSRSAQRMASLDDGNTILSLNGPCNGRALRTGVFAFFRDAESCQKHFSALLEEFNGAMEFTEPVHVLYVGFSTTISSSLSLPTASATDAQLVETCSAILKGHEKTMLSKGIRRVTFVVNPINQASALSGVKPSSNTQSPLYYTFRHRVNYAEDPIVRHIEPAYALHLQINRLSKFDIHYVPTSNQGVHLFAATPKEEEKKEEHKSKPNARVIDSGNRFFVRTLVRKLDSTPVVPSSGNSLLADTPSPAPSTASRSTTESDDDFEEETLMDLDAHPEVEFALVECLNALEIAIGGEHKKYRNNSIFLNVLVEVVLDINYIEAVIRMLSRRYSDKLRRLSVSMVEFTICLKPSAQSEQSNAYRFVCHNPTGFSLIVDIYEERVDPATGKIYFHWVVDKNSKDEYLDVALGRGVLDGQDINTPYLISTPFQRQRALAESMETLYVYDHLPVLKHALSKIWYRFLNPPHSLYPEASDDSPAHSGATTPRDQVKEKSTQALMVARMASLRAASPELRPDVDENKSPYPVFDLDGLDMPEQLMDWVELVVDFSNPQGPQLKEVKRPVGQNTVGMVAWKLTLRTPEYPSGRDVVLIANDITFQAGTFGPQEDIVFDLASKYARECGLPRLYFSANSGARIGLAEELRHKFKVAWVNDDVSKGYSYLYLDSADYETLKDSVKAQERVIVHSDGQKETRYVITDIIGRRDGLGVENLRGSGTIAGETSCAYEQIFTLTYCCGRSVGIGAYLARLGQRCIQKDHQPIILTGFNALNKLLGKQVYNSNLQLGGPEIMYPNGVSHLIVENDMEGAKAVLRWLSFVPASRFAPSPLLPSPSWQFDPIDRLIEYKPTKQPYDPRLMLGGYVDEKTGHWVSGFLDRDSWMEVLGGWARGVVVGRGRLGGYPIGVIAVETRTVEEVVPADPASPDSKEQVLPRAGQVWFPDSAFKTAQGIRDMVAEDLPIMIFANWRGFSGGQRDMFEQVLKYGSYIVDALRAVRQPIMVYIPPNGQLRGGAWVVVDPTINEQVMEMYADETSRGGVLEVEGTLDVKFRKADVIATAYRLDPVLLKLSAELKQLQSSPQSNTSSRTVAVVQAEIRTREKQIFPLYHQVAAAFADSHDTAGRMKAKGCIREVVSWEKSRTYFYWRIRRRVAELAVVRRIVEADPNTYGGDAGWKAANQLLSQWYGADRNQVADSVALEWLNQNKELVEQHINQLKMKYLADQFRQRLSGEALTYLVQQLTEEEKTLLRAALQ